MFSVLHHWQLSDHPPSAAPSIDDMTHFPPRGICVHVSSVCEEKGRGKGRGKEQDKTHIINVHCENCAHTSLLPVEVCPPDAAGNKVGYDPVTITRKGAKSSMRYDLMMEYGNLN